MTEWDQANPFAAPTASLVTPGSALPILRPAMIPATFCGAFAGFGFVVAPVFLAIMIRTWRNVFDLGLILPTHPERRYAPTPSNLTTLLLILFIGVFGILGARAWLRHRGRDAAPRPRRGAQDGRDDRGPGVAVVVPRVPRLNDDWVMVSSQGGNRPPFPPRSYPG